MNNKTSKTSLAILLGFISTNINAEQQTIYFDTNLNGDIVEEQQITINIDRAGSKFIGKTQESDPRLISGSMEPQNVDTYNGVGSVPKVNFTIKDNQGNQHHFTGAYTNQEDWVGTWYGSFGEKGDFKLSNETTGGSSNLKSCNEILTSGQSTGDGFYTIDPDGQGGVDSFSAYCDMTTNGGGWTLYANHKTQTVALEVDSVKPTELGVSKAERWNALKTNMTQGMMFIDENNNVTYINKHKLTRSDICLNIHDVDKLTGIEFIWNEEISGCSVSGSDYSLIPLRSSAYGTSLHQQGNIKFDTWPYGSATYSPNSDLLYFIK